MRLFIVCCLLLLPALLSANELTAPKVKVYKSSKEIQLSDIELWQRQLLTIEVNFTTNEEFSYISVDKTQNQSFLFKHKIHEQKRLDITGEFNKSVTLYFWPLKTGVQKLIIPVVNLKLSGRSIEKLALSSPNILVNRLPAYLPSGFPVGKIEIESQYSGNSFLPFVFTPGKLASYQLIARSSGLDESFVPDYSNYLENTDITRLTSNQKLISSTYNHDYILTRRFTIPMVTNSNGLTGFNSFKVFSFDPETAKVISYHYKPDALLSLNIPAQLLLTIIVLFILYFLSQFFIRRIQYVLSRRKQWNLIYLSNDALQLSLALKNLPYQDNKTYDSCDFNQSNTSLSNWSESWNSIELTRLINNLNEIVFSEQSGLDFSVVKQDIVSALRKHENFIFFCHTGKITR